MQQWQQYLLAALLLIALIGNYKGITLSDEYLYAEQAVALAQGHFEWTNSAFANRFGQLLPMAVLVNVLGPQASTMVLWSSICLIALVLVFRIWARAAFEERAAWTAVWLLVLNPSLLFYGADVSHDLVMTAFSFFALYFLWRRVRPGVMVACLAWAFLTKMAVLFLMPFFLWMAWWDLRQGRCIPFWRTTALLGLGFIVAFFGGYEVLQGDWLFRFRGIAQEHNISEWSYYQKSLSEFWQRLTIGPAAFIAQSAGLGLPLVLAGLGLFRFDPKKLDELPNFLFGFLLATLVFFWWGSTSLSSYNPMLLAERMWLVFIPISTLLGVCNLHELTKGLSKLERRWLPLLGILGLSACAAGTWAYGLERPFFLLTFFGIVWTWVLLAGKSTLRVYFAVLIALLVAIQVRRISENWNAPFFHEAAFFESLPPTPQLILADTMFNKLPWVHHGFEPAEQLKIRSWQTIQGSELAPYDTIYLLKQTDRMQLEVDYFKLQLPDFVKNAADTTILSMDGLIIEAIDANRLRSLLPN